MYKYMQRGEPLPQANRSLCVISLVSYVWLFGKGIGHTMRRLLNRHDSVDLESLSKDTQFLCYLYLYEVLVAFVCNASTLYRWRRAHFVLHHLLFLVLTLSLICLNPLFPHRAVRSCTSFLLIGHNEAFAVLRVINLGSLNDGLFQNKYFNLCRLSFTLTVIVCMIFWEIFEAICILLFIEEQVHPLYYFAVFLAASGGSLYHITDVLPVKINDFMHWMKKTT